MSVCGKYFPIASVGGVAGYLVELVKDGGLPVTYSDLLEHFGLPRISRNYRWHQSPMKDIFSAMDATDEKAGLPLRTSMVVRKDTEIPGNGYFKTLGKHRGVPVPTSESERRELHGVEMKRLAEHYRQNGIAPD